jgi:hypothetical protein
MRMNTNIIGDRRPAYRPEVAVLVAALAGGEDDIREALEVLNQHELSRLRNALRAAADLTEARRQYLWRTR